MSARDVIADWLNEAAIQNGFENSRGKSINDHADDILSALDAAGYAVVPKKPTREMLNAAIDTDRFKLGDIKPLGFRCSPQQMFRASYAAILTAAKETK